MNRAIARPGGPGVGQYLDDHLLAVAKLAAEFAKPWGGEHYAFLLGLWHDLGKFSPLWQHYLNNGGTKVNHSSAGAIHAQNKIPGALGRCLAWVIAGHHTGLADFSNGDRTHGPIPLQERLQQKNLLDEALRGNPASEILDPVLPTSAPTGRDRSLFIRMLFSALVDADRLNSEEFGSPHLSALRGRTIAMADLAKKIDAHLSGLMARAEPTSINQIRHSLLNDCLKASTLEPGLFSMTAPTGLGKTLSGMAFSLHHAANHDLRRVIYVAPYTSIIEQTAAVFRDAIGKEAVLEHHSSITDKPDETQKDRIAADLARENWDSPVIVTTAVQFFESLFSGQPRRCRKLHRIPGSVIFLDEAHLIPTEFLKPITHALEELMKSYGVTVILSTATQPSLDPAPRAPVELKGPEGRREIVHDPIALHQSAVTRIRTTFPHDWYQRSTWEEIAGELKQRHSALCIVNTRAHAQTLHSLLPPGAFHLSASMCAEHRADRLAEIKALLASGAPVHVVATQLIEAGVDIDFPCVFRALAGLDSLAQAAGRCNRAGKLMRRGEFVVFIPPSDPPPGPLRKAADSTRAVMRKHSSDPFSPASFDEFFRNLYAKTNTDEADIIKLQKDGRLAETSSRFRLIDETETVLVPYGPRGDSAVDAFLRASAGETVGGLFDLLQRLTVSMTKKACERLANDGHITRLDTFGIWVAKKSAYDITVGLSANAISDNSF